MALRTLQGFDLVAQVAQVAQALSGLSVFFPLGGGGRKKKVRTDSL